MLTLSRTRKRPAHESSVSTKKRSRALVRLLVRQRHRLKSNSTIMAKSWKRRRHRQSGLSRRSSSWIERVLLLGSTRRRGEITARSSVSDPESVWRMMCVHFFIWHERIHGQRASDENEIWHLCGFPSSTTGAKRHSGRAWRFSGKRSVRQSASSCFNTML